MTSGAGVTFRQMAAPPPRSAQGLFLDGCTGATSRSATWPGGEHIFIGTSDGYSASALIRLVADLGSSDSRHTVSVGLG